MRKRERIGGGLEGRRARKFTLPTLLVPPLLSLGCSSSPALFLLEIGRSQKYTVSSGLAKHVVTLTVAARTPVAGVDGYELRSTMGNFRLAWKNGWLVAESLAGTRFSPPLPILSEVQGFASATWKGKVSTLGSTQEGSAKIEQDWTAQGARRDAAQGARVVVTLRAGGKEIETESWYVPKRGLVEQTQRVDGLLTIGMRAL